MPNHDQPSQQSAARTPLALQRAKHALHAINKLPGKSKTEVGNYLAYVKGLPANILRSGLGQALAMEKAGAKSDDGHKFLFDHVESWLMIGWPNSRYRGCSGGLLKAIVDGDQTKYVRAQAEALAYLEWLKKFAVAFLDDDDQATTASAEPGGAP